MEVIISNLVKRFEEGKVSRRELVRSLALLSVAGTAAAAPPRQETPFSPSRIDHISIQVTDIERSNAFYRDIFGLSILNEDQENQIVRMGVDDRIIVSLHQKAPTGIVDHYAIAVDDFNREEVARALEAHGLTAEQNLDYGFYVRDPEGIPVQIVGT